MSFPIGEIRRPNQLAQGGGFVTVTNLLAKIGGQTQYKASASVAIPALTANTLYMVYAVLTAPNTPALVISTNANSVGPVGFTAWELVGAFFSGQASNFAAFISIDGAPSSEWYSDSAGLFFDGTTSAPTKATTKIVDRAMIKIVNGMGLVSYEYRHADATGSAAGSGDYKWRMPALKIDTTKVTAYTTVEGFNSNFLNNNIKGSCQGGNGANQFFGNISVFDQDYVRFVAGDDSSNTQGFIGSAGYQITTTNVYYLADFFVPLQGISGTPLKDL